MSTRYLIAAAFLFGSACGAHADVLPATSTAQSGFLSSWTTGGTDVASTGVLGSGTTLVGGGSSGVAQALYQKASANVGATDGKINLSLAEGLNGTYVVKTGNKALAALLSNGARVMTTADGVEVSYGDHAPDTASGAVGGAFPAAGVSTGNTGSGTNVNTGAGSNDVAGGPVPQLPSEINAGTGTGAGAGVGLPTAGPAAVNGEVPEPSSIALLMAGMMGALALTRRRAK